MSGLSGVYKVMLGNGAGKTLSTTDSATMNLVYTRRTAHKELLVVLFTSPSIKGIIDREGSPRR